MLSCLKKKKFKYKKFKKIKINVALRYKSKNWS